MKRILIVEDNEVNRRMLVRRLSARGFLLTEAGTGEEGIESATASPPDAVLMDLGLPGIDGWEATRRLRANPRTRHVPVIALSAHAHQSDRDNALAAGCADFETKPVNLPVLISKLEAVLSRGTPADEDSSIFSALRADAPSQGAATEVIRNPPRVESQSAGGPGVDLVAAPAADACPVDRKRVLVVEDHAANRAMLARLVGKLGHEAIQAADGHQALELLRVKAPVDLVLLDMMMPGLDGESTLGRIKNDPQLAAIPVVMVSALDESATVARCIEAGAEDYLHKPYDPVLLKARVNASLDKRRLRERDLEALAALGALARAAESIERGHFEGAEVAAVATRADELGRLARVFLTMAEGVQARENSLRGEVERLRVAIDERRAAERVAEVTENRYFTELQERATGLRARGRRPTPPADAGGS